MSGLSRLEEILGEDASLLHHVCKTIPKEVLHLPGPDFNDRVVALHERFGSKVEGVLRQHIIKNGVKHDVVRMAVLADEWPDIREKYRFDEIEIESP